MKKAICLILAAVFVLVLCSCSGKDPDSVASVNEKEMIKQMFSDLSKKNFDKIASKSVYSDGSNVKEEDIKSIYDLIAETGADPSLGFTIEDIIKNTNINLSGSTSHSYSILTLCGDKYVRFFATIEKQSTGYYFTQIYTVGVVTADSTDTEA